VVVHFAKHLPAEPTAAADESSGDEEGSRTAVLRKHWIGDSVVVNVTVIEG
jgi:hypothetical protein